MARKSTKQTAAKRRAAKHKAEAEKLVPDSDRAFAAHAQTFAATISGQPDRYMLGADDVEVISDAVQSFRDALARRNPHCNHTIP